MGREHRLEGVLHALDLLGDDLDVARLALGSGIGLVEKDAGVGQGETLARCAGRQQHRGRRRRLPEADRGDVGLDVRHRVVDGEQRVDVATGAVDVEVDVLVGVLRLEVQQLGADEVGDEVVDRPAEEDDVLAEQPGEQVTADLAPRGLLDDVGHVHAGVDVHHSSSSP